MPKYFKNKNTRYSKLYDLLGEDLISSETENMYINYNRSDVRLESFPGYRKITSEEGTVHGLYDFNMGDDGCIAHIGTKLYKLHFIDSNRDFMTSQTLSGMEDKKSLSFRTEENISFVNGNYITVVDKDLNATIASTTGSQIYIPTTYVNGCEAEQFNLLTNQFKEETISISEADYAYESEGLHFKIISESACTCAVVGVDDGVLGRVEIPNRKMINGRYYKVVEVGDNAFEGKDFIHTMIVGSGVKRIGKSAFRNCTGLRVVALPGIEEIDDAAFLGCSSITKMYIGDACKKICYNSFDGLPDTAIFYLAGSSECYTKCEGIGNIMMYSYFYSEKFTDISIGIPIYTPAKIINSVKVDGEAIQYSNEIKRGLIKITRSNMASLEGKSICIECTVSDTVLPASERGIPFNHLLSADTTAREEILSCAGSGFFDNRAFLFAPKSFPNMVIMSSFTREGKAHPLYFGSLDYFTVGSSQYPITDIKKEGSRLAVAKKSERGGSIFLCQPKGEERACFGRRYPIIYTLENTGIRSPLYEFSSSTIFIGTSGVCRMKYSSSSAVFETISTGCPSSLENDLKSDVIFSSYGGYLLIFSRNNMYLGDSRLTFPVRGLDMRQLKWFPITNIGSYKGDCREYFYAQTAVDGTYIHPNVGEVATGTVYSYVDENGDTIYYVQSGLRKYRVLPGEELVGGELIPVSAALSRGNTIFFGTESGDIFIFNTDKVGKMPREMYTQANHNFTVFNKAYLDRIHPSFYTNAGHRVRYSITTPPYDGEVPYVMKSNMRGSLTSRIERMSLAKIKFSTQDQSGKVMELDGVKLGEVDFYEMDFDKIAFDSEDVAIVSVPERQGKWAEKQITVYTDELKSPFAISSISHGFKIDGQITNR